MKEEVLSKAEIMRRAKEMQDEMTYKFLTWPFRAVAKLVKKIIQTV